MSTPQKIARKPLSLKEQILGFLEGSTAGLKEVVVQNLQKKTSRLRKD